MAVFGENKSRHFDDIPNENDAYRLLLSLQISHLRTYLMIRNVTLQGADGWRDQYVAFTFRKVNEKHDWHQNQAQSQPQATDLTWL